VVDLATAHAIDLIVVGPEAPLVAGVADAARAAGFAVSARAPPRRCSKAQGLHQGSVRRAGIPTAAYVRVETEGRGDVRARPLLDPGVIKADGLAAGKGVTVAMTAPRPKPRSRGGRRPMVIEEFLEGEEASLFALVDGERAVVLASAQDHKRVGEGDTGPNTGGMGAYSPAPVLTPELEARAMREIVEPTARAMAEAGTPFSGALRRPDADRRRPQADRI
jgi:phosphoribosylamine--glycine ligase